MELIFDPTKRITSSTGDFKLKDGPTFNVWKSARPPQINTEEPIKSTYWDTLTTNIYNILSKRNKSLSSKEPEYVTDPYKEQEQIQIPLSPEKNINLSRIIKEPWNGPRLNPDNQKEYNYFISELNKAIDKRPEYNTPEWREFLIHLADAENNSYREYEKSKWSRAKGWYQLMDPKREWNTSQDQLDDVFDLLKEKRNTLKNIMKNPEIVRLMEQRGIDEYAMLGGLWLKGEKDTVDALYGKKTSPDGTGRTTVDDYFRKFTQL